LITERAHDLVVGPLDDGLTVEGDAERLTQVLVNLLINAAKYMDPGGSIKVSTATTDAAVTVRVRDTGFGIPQFRMETLFENFNQIPEHQSRTGGGGLGIGLALARQIVELHGGAITASSGGLDCGSEFAVALPLAQDEAAATVVAPTSAAGDSPRRILVVDDNIDAAESLRFLLEARGHIVETVYDGPEALGQVVEFDPGIVLLDIGLPGMDGYEVARRIRAMPNGSRIRLFAVTGWGQAGDKQRALDAGFDSHVTKPMDLATLSRLIGEERVAQ
jgi:CheY-like chemotaxis protein